MYQVEGPAAARGDAAHGPVAPPDGVAPRGLRQGHLQARPAGAVAQVAAARDDEVAARRHADGAGRNRRHHIHERISLKEFTDNCSQGFCPVVICMIFSSSKINHVLIE